MIVSSKWIYRAWYYFRQGYSTYLTFILGYASTLVTVYYLAIRNVPPLLDVFPHFTEFGILATTVGVPLAVIVGWVHMKRSGLYSSEADIANEASPYNYKLPPGYAREASFPVMLSMLRLLRRLSEANGLMTDSEKIELDELDKKMVILVRGGYVGSPRRELRSLL